jgi:hypothetical protein
MPVILDIEAADFPPGPVVIERARETATTDVYSRGVPAAILKAKIEALQDAIAPPLIGCGLTGPVPVAGYHESEIRVGEIRVDPRVVDYYPGK